MYSFRQNIKQQTIKQSSDNDHENDENSDRAVGSSFWLGGLLDFEEDIIEFWQ